MTSLARAMVMMTVLSLHISLFAPLQKDLRCAVDHISFSAHADFEQTSGFLDTTRPPHVVLVHGEVSTVTDWEGVAETI